MPRPWPVRRQFHNRFCGTHYNYAEVVSKFVGLRGTCHLYRSGRFRRGCAARRRTRSLHGRDNGTGNGNVKGRVGSLLDLNLGIRQPFDYGGVRRRFRLCPQRQHRRRFRSADAHGRLFTFIFEERQKRN